MTTKGFTKINNSIIFDADLSLEALGLYIKLKHLSTIDNFSIKRDYVKSLSGYGETAFRRVWKELKDKSVLIETKIRNKGRYEYIYTLKGQESTKTTALAGVKKIKADSDGNAPLDGQINIDEVKKVDHQEVSVATENIMTVAKETGFTGSESLELLKIANNKIDRVLECYKYTLKQKDVKNVFAYTKVCIAKKIQTTKENYSKILNFNNYEQRKYDYDKLENALLYGEQYELPI